MLFPLAVLLFLLSGARLCLGASSTLAVVGAGIEQSEDAPFVSPGYEFLPGDYLYLTFQIAGFGIKSENRDEVHKISLEYDAGPQDRNGVPLTETVKGVIATELSAEDKHWAPKRSASFLIPSFVSAGEYRVHVHVKDLVTNTEASQDFPFRVGGVTIQPASSIAIQNFQFFRNENDAQPLDVPAYSPGDPILARFDMTGFKLESKNQYHLSYGLIVLRPDGKPFVDKPNAAEVTSSSFYPAQYVPGVVDLKTSEQMPRGEYLIVLTVRDRIGNTSAQMKRAFSIE